MQKIIIVGTGDYYKNIIAPSLELMSQEGLIEVVCTVGMETVLDSAKPISFKNIEHRIRKPGESLSFLLSDFKGQNIAVILGHANEFHVSDSVDLVNNGFKVMVEKPYCIDKEQMGIMKDLIINYSDKIVPLEYYLMMKSVPLLIFAGKVQNDSFYFTNEKILKIYDGMHTLGLDLKGLSGKLEEFIGKPRSILVEVLEGEGDTGKIDHRGPHLCELKRGGGMIQDLGIHALSPIFALEDYFGEIDESFKDGKVRIAKSNEYIEMAKSRFQLSEREIGESYAEFEFVTSKNVPVFVSVGKYVFGDRNQRRIVVIGSEGRLYFDLSSCTLYIARFDSQEVKVLEIPKMPSSKYYPVVRLSSETLNGKKIFNFDVTQKVLKTQAFVLNVLEKAHRSETLKAFYNTGVIPREIFK